MTVSSTTTKVSFSGNGSTTAFAVGFYFLQTSHLKVTLRSALGLETVKTLGSDYTVTGAGVASGGTVTMTVAPASGETLVIQRNAPLTQLVDYQPNDPFPANTHEQALDQLTMETQQLQEQINRSIKISTTNTMTSTEFTVDATNRALKVLGFDAAGELSVTQELGTFKGNWAASTAYKQRDLIKDTSNNNIYICLTAHTSTGAQPISTNTDSAKWSLIVDAATATSSASAAASSASAASTSATNAATSASNASTSASTASTQASNASSSASAASSSASSASTSATNASNSATAASASAAAAAASAASGLYRQVLDKSANYTILAADGGTLFRASTGSGAITFTLPQISTVTDGFKVSIVKWTNDANAVNANRSGSDTINGTTTIQIGAQYAQITLVADFETNTWFASQTGLGATNRNVDVFTGNNSTTGFTLSADPGTKYNTDVFISGVHQDHANYSVSGTTLTFTTAPPTGTNNIQVVYSTPLAIGTPSDYTVTLQKIARAGTAGQALISGGAGADASWQNIQAFPSGTALVFAQTAAPTGWTKSTTHNDKALRVVSGSASSGGSVAFSSAFVSQAVAGTVGSTTLDTTMIPSHTHSYTTVGSTQATSNAKGGVAGNTAGSTTGATGGGLSHNHTFSGTAINLAVQYVDVIIATKD